NFSVLQGGGECHAPLCPAGYIVTEGHFVGGIYQQVPVSAGNTYYANIIWLVFDSLANDAAVHGAVGGIGRRIGIDPTGGTDSRSPNVVWSEDNWRNDCKICGVEEVTVTAQAEVITVFLRIDDTWRVRAAEKQYAVPPSKDQFWIDDIGLKQVGEGEAPPPPTEPPPLPTDTPVPPTVTPEIAQLTAAEEPEQEEATLLQAAETVAEEEASEADRTGDETGAEDNLIDAEPATSTTAPAGPTVAPPPTLTPTNTPSPTETAVALAQPQQPRPLPTLIPSQRLAAQPASAGASFGSLGSIAGTTACVGGIFLVIIGIALFGVAWLYRLGWGEAEDDEAYHDYDGYDDDDDYIEVEIVE
ncbi:MAG: hypothetical protein R3264_12000, partial [Anaerolineae bacterium]|nr:hypothetical protein [Anaerolineae bacterium]